MQLNKSFFFEKIGKYSSFFSVLFLIGAVWFEHLYYDGFGIEIFTYITFSEIISLFLGYIPFLLFIAVVVGFFILVMNLLFAKFLEKLKNKHELSKFEVIKLNTKIYLITGYLGASTLLILFLPLVFGWKPFLYSEWFLITKVFGIFIFLYWTLIPFIASKVDTNVEHMVSVLFIIIFFISIYYLASYKLWAAKHDSKNYFPVTTITLKDSTKVSSGDSLLFVGKTNDYIFLYSEQFQIEKSHIKVIPMDEITSLKVYSHLKWLTFP